MATTQARSDLWKDMRPADLPGELREIAESLGMDAARYLVESWGGLQIYVHTETSVLRARLYEAIRKEWNGRNEAELARRYGVPRRTIGEALRSEPAVPDPAQHKLFG